MGVLGDFLGNGQNRRKWLDETAQDGADALKYYLGPTGIPDRLGAVAKALQFSDAGDMVEAAEASRSLWNDPSIESAVDYATAGAAMAIPFVGARMMNQGVDVVGDALRSGADDVRTFGASEYGGTELNPVTMYHGTPDVRGIRESGGFQAKTQGVRRVKDQSRYNELRTALGDVTPGTKEYFRILDELGDVTETAEVPSPVFLTTNRSVADSYADDTRAFDYQNAEPMTLPVKSNPERVLDVDARGESFRGISKEQVRQGLRNVGIPDEEIDAVINRYIFGRDEGTISTDDLAALANDFGFQAVDVKRVRDNYFGAGPQSTVRMVMDPSLIEMLKKYGLAGMAMGGAAAYDATTGEAMAAPPPRLGDVLK